jgi:hypothetical protein
MEFRPVQILFALLITLMPVVSFASAATEPAPVDPKPLSASPLAGMSIKQLIALTPRSYRELTGNKMTFKQRIILKMTQRKMKKEIRNHPEIDVNAPVSAAGIFDTSDFNPWALVLGLVPVVGILIAYLTNDNVIIKWAWVGTGIVLLILLLFLIF